MNEAAGKYLEKALPVLLLLPVLFAAPPADALKDYNPPEIRVLIARVEGAVTVEADGLKSGWTKLDRAVLESGGRGLKVNGRRTRTPLVLEAGSPISVDGREYRGKIVVTGDEPPLVVNELDVESYLYGLINQEINSRWPAESVDAQAILARTYALRKYENNDGGSYHLGSTTNDQVYGGVAAEDELAREAVDRTRGQVLAYDGSLAVTYYHACCGGRTELPSEVWGGRNLPYQQSVACSYCMEAPRYFWRFPEKGAIPPAELAQNLGLRGKVNEIELVGRDMSGRVTRIRVNYSDGSVVLSGQEFRKRIGYKHMFSTSFRVDREDGGYTFMGSGSGHGVGLCQWGAKAMAAKGFSSEAILRYYYPGTKISRYK